MEKQERFISLRLDDGLIGDLRKVSEKLSLGRSATVRLALQRLIGEYLGTKSDFIILERDKWDQIVGKFMERIEGEPERTKKAIEEVMEKVTDKLMEKVIKEGVLK